MNGDSIDAYETHARAFLAARDRSTVGVAVVKRWARSLPAGAEVLEIGCGGGYPVTRTLVDAGLRVFAVDASPTLLTEFAARFPDLPTECAAAQTAACFARQFDAVIAIGLVFLLDADDQAALIERMATLLVAGGRGLFTAPLEPGTWADVTTGHACLSLGEARYSTLLHGAGCHIVATRADEGRNNYYDVQRVERS